MAGMIAKIIDQSREDCSVYLEPYAGGLAVLYALDRFDVEVINDLDANIANFWIQFSQESEKFLKYCNARPVYHEALHGRAIAIWNGTETADCLIEQAWAVWYMSLVCFSSIMGASFRVSVVKSVIKTLVSRMGRISSQLDRTKRMVIHQQDAVKLIKRYDYPNVVIYADPPYPNADQKYACGDFSEDDLKRLCDALSDHSGKFVLSCYSNPTLDEFSQNYRLIKHETFQSASLRVGNISRRRIEILVTNIEERQISLF